MLLYDTETREHIWVEEYHRGLWLEQDPDSNLFNENARYMWIVPLGDNDIEGPDHIKYVKGPHQGQNVQDVLTQKCHRIANNGLVYSGNWQEIGLNIIHDFLKRFHPSDGFYHA